MVGKLRFTEFKHAYSLVSSRAFYVDNFHGLCMVPLADIFNHHYEPHVCLQADDVVCGRCGSYDVCEHDEAEERNVDSVSKGERAKQVVEMVATRGVEASTEVFNTYGELSNARLLAEYGFSLEANDSDRICWFSLVDLANDLAMSLEVIERAWQRKSSSNGTDDERIAPCSQQGGLQLHDQLYIDAESRLSRALWSVIKVLAREPELSLTELCDSAPSADALVVGLCRQRISRLTGSEMPLSQIFDLLDVSAGLQARDRWLIACVAVAESRCARETSHSAKCRGEDAIDLLPPAMAAARRSIYLGRLL